MSVSVVYVPRCQMRANFSFLYLNVPINVPMCQRSVTVLCQVVKCHVILKKSVRNFCFLKLFCSLVTNENTKNSGFYTLLVTMVFLNLPQLKQLNKMTNTSEYCDLLELGIRKLDLFTHDT